MDCVTEARIICCTVGRFMNLVSTIETPDRVPTRFSVRGGARIPHQEPLLISWEETGLEMVDCAYTVSISRGGCAISCRRFFPSGCHVLLEYQSRTINGHVVYSLNDRSNKSAQTGIGFARDAQDFWQIDFDTLAAGLLKLQASIFPAKD